MNPCHCYCSPVGIPAPVRLDTLAPMRLDTLAPLRAGSAYFMIDRPLGSDITYNAAVCTDNGYCNGQSLAANVMHPNPDKHTHIILNTEDPRAVPQNAPNIVRRHVPLPPSYCYFVVKPSGDAQVMSDSYYASPLPDPLPCSSHYHLINEGPGRGARSEITFP